MTERRFHRARLLLFECLKKPGASRPALHSDEAEAFLAASRAAFLRAVNCARATALLRAESRLSLHGVAEAHPTHGGVWARLMLPTTRLLFCAEVLAGAAGPAPRPSCSRRGSRAQRSECALRGCLVEMKMTTRRSTWYQVPSEGTWYQVGRSSIVKMGRIKLAAREDRPGADCDVLPVRYEYVCTHSCIPGGSCRVVNEKHLFRRHTKSFIDLVIYYCYIGGCRELQGDRI